MESNSNDNYVLVLEDRTEVKNEQEAGKLSVVSGIDDKGNLKTTEAIAANQAAFLKFNNKDGLLKNFMANFLKQFNNPTHFGLYKVLADNVEQGVDNLRTCCKTARSSKASSSWQRLECPLMIICRKRRIPLPSTTRKWTGRCSTVLDCPVRDWNRVENERKCLTGRRVISSQLPFPLAKRPYTPKPALRFARTITAISVWQFIL